jgi:hypothetical protein
VASERIGEGDAGGVDEAEAGTGEGLGDGRGGRGDHLAVAVEGVEGGRQVLGEVGEEVGGEPAGGVFDDFGEAEHFAG